MSARDIPRSVGRIDDSLRRPVVVGTDITVSQIARDVVHMGVTMDEVVSADPQLTLADGYAALIYFYDHQGAIRRDWAAAETRIADLESSPSAPRPVKTISQDLP